MQSLKVGMGTISQKNVVLGVTINSSGCPYAEDGGPTPNCLFFSLAKNAVGDEEPKCPNNMGLVRRGEDVFVICSLVK